MSLRNRVRWIYVRSIREEVLARVFFPLEGSKVQIPVVGKLNFQISSKSGRVRWEVHEPLKVVVDAEDGGALLRTLGGVISTERPRQYALLLCAAFCAAAFFVALVTPIRGPAALPMPCPVPTSIPVTPVPRSAHPGIRPEVRPTTRTDPVGSKARELFLRGDLSQAAFELNRARLAGKGHLPKPMSTLYSEVEYAICRQAFGKEEWENAVQHCRMAVQETRHDRAQGILNRLASRTRRYYLEGYAMEGFNPAAAIQRYREALRSAAPSDPYGEKAGQKMKAIEGVTRH